jgi:hypothetical protein
MGNKPFRVALKVEKLQYESEEVIKGRVYLSVDKKAQLDGVDGIHLRFEGWEQIAVHDSGNHHHNASQNSRERRVESSTNTLIRVDYPIIKRDQLKVGQYEYAFQWRLPADLPSSMHCKKKDSSVSFAEIRYTLTAYLAGPSKTKNGLPKSDISLNIMAKPPRRTTRQIIADVEEYPVNSCMFWSKGKVRLGWHAESDVVCPGGHLDVEVLGDNKSSREISYVSVKCIETVKWKSPESSHSKAVTRTLCEKRLSVEDRICWMPSLGLAARGEHSNYDPLHDEAMRTQITIPHDARDSYTGRLVTVRHMLVVCVETRGCATNSPESAFEVKIMRRLPRAETTPTVPPSTTPSLPMPRTTTTAATTATLNHIPEAQVVFSEWGPVVEDPVEVPLAQAVLLDEELDLAHQQQARSPIVPSAPDESLDVLTGSSTTTTIANSPSNFALPDLNQLLTLVRDAPSNLPVVLEDDIMWVRVVQKLSPRDFGRVVAQAGPQASSTVAHVLAMSMHPRFQCRHVLACLWTLPDDNEASVSVASNMDEQRREILQQTAPLISDLDTNQTNLEQELTPEEVAVFRRAILEASR